MLANGPEDRLDLLVLAWLSYQSGKPALPKGVAAGLKALLPPGAADGLVAPALQRLVRAGHVEAVEPPAKAPPAAGPPKTKKPSAKPPKPPKVLPPTYRITAAGGEAVAAWLGGAGAAPPTLKAVVDSHLPAMAVGLPAPAGKAAQTAFGKLLPAAVCARRFRLDVPLDQGLDAAKLTLVKLGLARLNGVPVDRIHLKAKLPAKSELLTLIVGPLVGQPATRVDSLDKLLAAVAADVLGGGGATAAKLKAALVRHWLKGDDDGGDAVAPDTVAAPASESAAATDNNGTPDAPAPNGTERPDGPVDLPTFTRRVLTAAADVARAGGGGLSNLGDKVLVQYAWRRYQAAFGPIPLDAFKARLSEANGTHVDLVREDRIPADRADEFRDAEVRTGAASYHYIRVRD